MAEAKTRVTDVPAETSIEAIEPAAKRADAPVLDALLRKVTGEAPQMWGPGIIGYGSYDYRYESGHSGTSLRSGFSPRKAKHSLYIHCGIISQQDLTTRKALLERLGKHGEGKSCVYVSKLADIDMAVIEDLIRYGWESMARAYPTG
jgi:hypothetical protein